MAARYRQRGLITPYEQEEIGKHLLVQYCERLPT
jgi:hypothetical protein